MALQNDTSRIQYNGNNSTTSSYAIPFVFFENAHIKCVVTSSAGVDSTLALGSGFNVTGAANPNGGSLTTTTAVPTSSKVTIFREVPATQTTSYQEGGDFPAASHERALDKLTMIAQQTKRLADRALKVPETQNNPNDLPNAGSGNKALVSNGGSIQWSDNRPVPIYPTGQGAKLLAAPGGGGEPSWQDAPNIAAGAFAANTKLINGGSVQFSAARFNGERWGDTINVKDFGAVGDGVADDWLPIQRAISQAFREFDASTLTESDLVPWGGLFNEQVMVPRLYRGQGRATVYIPSGTYKISKPLIISAGTRIIGQARNTYIKAAPNYYGALIEDAFVWVNRTFFANQPANRLFGDASFEYVHGAIIEGLTFINNGVGFTTPNGPGPTISGYNFLRFPFGGGGPVMTTNALVNAGSTTVDLNQGFPMPIGTSPKWKIQFANHSTVYDVEAKSIPFGTTITLSPPLTQSVSAGTVVKIGIGRIIGINIGPGENSQISNCDIYNCDIGVYTQQGSPTPLIQDVSVWGCDVAFWCDGGPSLLIRPSGDGNNVFVRGGMLTSSNITMIGCKAESMYAPSWRSFVEVTTSEQSSASQLTILGGNFNPGPPSSLGQTTADNSCILRIFKNKFNQPGHVHISGLNTISGGTNFALLVEAETGTIEKRWPRSGARDGEEYFSFGSVSRHAASVLERYNYTNNAYNFRFTPQSVSMAAPGYPVYHGAGTILEYESGLLPGTAQWSRSETTLTMTYADHNLQVGDYVWPRDGSNFGGFPISFPSNDSDGYLNVMAGSTFRVKSIVNANTFTAECLNSGPTSGTARIAPMRYVDFHTLQYNEHRFQMPHVLGNSSNQYVAFGYYDKKSNLIAGLRVPSEKNAEFYVAKQLSIGGTIQSPSAIVLTGTAAPGMSAPNGSLYLRTDGDASTTLYVRASGAWKPLASYDP